MNLIKMIAFLKINPLFFSDPDLFVYCCDFSSNAINLVKVSCPEYVEQRPLIF